MVGSFIAAVLFDRFKRPTPIYNFNFEKQVPYKVAVGLSVLTKHLENYICIENYGDVSLWNVSTKISFAGKKRSHYRRIKISKNVFNLDIEYLAAYSPNVNDPILDLFDGREEVIEKRSENGFFVGRSDMKKLKCVSPIEIKVEYEWNGKQDSDIWLFNFSDENDPRFGIPRPPLWQRVMLFIKRRFL